ADTAKTDSLLKDMSSVQLSIDQLSGKNLSYLPRLNFSLDDAEKELQQHFSKDKVFDRNTEIIIICLYSTLIISGVISNFLISGIILRNAQICSPRYPYVINLNIADLIMCVFCIPFTLVAVIRKRWILGEILCKFVPFVQGSTVFLSSATVSVIAVDRHKNVLNAFPAGRKKKNKGVMCSIISVWLISFVLSSPISYAQTIKNVGLPGIYTYEKCIESWPWTKAKGIYTVITVLAQFLIPALVLFITHLRIESHLNYELRRNRRATIVLLTITIVFSLTWLPWNILNLIADFHPTSMSPQNLYLSFVICHIIAMTSATSNPILYGWLNSNIRREILIVKERLSSAISVQKRITSGQNDSVETMRCKNMNLQ
ncbi:neuropeptide F receptor-like, partial [Stegodyphus dumicola]|uniref:neuropeptide F receptor-like n=1 Tax=Stegodyphus dumicola TaxID=202533 RepID=UPI0015A7EE72